MTQCAVAFTTVLPLRSTLPLLFSFLPFSLFPSASAAAALAFAAACSCTEGVPDVTCQPSISRASPQGVGPGVQHCAATECASTQN